MFATLKKWKEGITDDKTLLSAMACELRGMPRGQSGRASKAAGIDYLIASAKPPQPLPWEDNDASSNEESTDLALSLLFNECINDTEKDPWDWASDKLSKAAETLCSPLTNAIQYTHGDGLLFTLNPSGNALWLKNMCKKTVQLLDVERDVRRRAKAFLLNSDDFFFGENSANNYSVRDCKNEFFQSRIKERNLALYELRSLLTCILAYVRIFVRLANSSQKAPYLSVARQAINTDSTLVGTLDTVIKVLQVAKFIGRRIVKLDGETKIRCDRWDQTIDPSWKDFENSRIQVQLFWDWFDEIVVNTTREGKEFHEFMQYEIIPLLDGVDLSRDRAASTLFSLFY